MYRIVTKYRDQGTARPTVEYGPWHTSREHAEYWAALLRQSGYVVEIETQRGQTGGGNDDLAAALASMA